MTTQIIKCTCKHQFQDETYGVGNRVANVMRTGQSKCTVCGTIGGSKAVFVKPITASDVKAPVEKGAMKEDVKKERRSSKFKTKEKKPSKDTKTPKPKIDRSKKMNKK